MSESNTSSSPNNQDESPDDSLFNGKLLIKFMGGAIVVMLLIGVGILIFA